MQLKCNLKWTLERLHGRWSCKPGRTPVADSPGISRLAGRDYRRRAATFDDNLELPVERISLQGLNRETLHIRFKITKLQNAWTRMRERLQPR